MALRQFSGLLARCCSSFSSSCNTGFALAFGSHFGFLTSRDEERTPTSSGLDSSAEVRKILNSQMRQQHSLPLAGFGGATRNPLLAPSLSSSALASPPSAGQTAAMSTATITDDSWQASTLPAILRLFSEGRLAEEVVQSIIKEHKELGLRDKELGLRDKELEVKDLKLQRAIQDFLRAQGKFDARGLFECAQGLLATSKEAALAPPGSQRWQMIYNDNTQLFKCIKKKLGMRLTQAQAASMTYNAYSLISGAIHSGRFIQPDIDDIIIYEGVMPRDLMLLTECVAQEVGAPYKMVYIRDAESTKSEL